MIKLGLGLGVTLLLAGCQSMTVAKVIEKERQNITTSSYFSLTTQSITIASGFGQKECMQKFEACLASVNQSYFDPNSKLRLATLAELYYAQALYLKASDPCQVALQRPPIDPYYTNAPLNQQIKHQQNRATHDCQNHHLDSLYNALRYSYAYVFYDNLTGKTTTSNLTDETSIRTQDIYHMAIYGVIGELYWQDSSLFDPSTPPKQTSNSRYLLLNRHANNLATPATLSIHLANDTDYLQNLLTDNSRFWELTSIYDNRLPNLTITSSRTGLGVGYVGSMGSRHQNTLTILKNTQNKDPDQRIYPMQHLLLTAIITPKAKTVQEVLSAEEFDLYLLNPYKNTTIDILGKNYPLFANFSAGYAKWLSENQFRQLALVQMLATTDVRLPELYMLEPYNPNKKVIIMIHGLASSPSTWVNLTNSLLADPNLQNNYQVWQVFYATNLPILENRYQIHKLINHAFAMTDPKGTHKASHNAIIISHSMGAVISRLMLSDDDLNEPLKRLQKPSYRLNLDEQEKQQLAKRMQLSALPQVDTAVFISAPFQGTDYADRWFSKALMQLIHLPAGLSQSIKKGLAGDGFDLAQSPLARLYLQNGASQLSDKSAFMKLTKHVQIHPSVRYHSIIANNTDYPQTQEELNDYVSDGIVPYASAHLEGASSEVVIEGGHGIHHNPKTILHLRKILHEQLGHE